jgi:hypothetical protein
MRRISNLLLLALLCAQCTKYNPKYTFDPLKSPPPPDYSQSANWAAHPDTKDEADRTPNTKLLNIQAEAQADVFFLHPTTLLQKHKNGDVWNGNVQDKKLNKTTDDSPILYQASAFNGAGRVFAPRYRQAHYWSFVTTDKVSSDKAMDLAYSDVRAAFKYYLQHNNNGRPFIIASHSQGAAHAIRLIREEIENTPLMNQLIVAYIAGWPVKKGAFKKIKPCQSPTETGCFCTWRTYERNFGLKNATQDSVFVTNPLTWTIQERQYANKSLNKGAVLKNFNKVYPGICDAEGYRGVLLCTKPKFPGSFLLRDKNYHIGDINLYYMDIRENAALRVKNYVKTTK